ncbi:MAG TPA: SLBB domain-containing protein, partial [Chthonomonadales bacterium]|nr:SLBB domain-containing protein [Chthonomonadales bacterium]
MRLSSLRTISVTVAGDVYLPGGYSVPAVVSAYTLLDYAGGPTDQGSFRNIEVRRQGKVIHSLDLYKFILFGSQSDFSLQSGDSIFIPRAGARVSVSGEVLHPAVYELRNGESLSDALHYAGGVKASGVKQSVQVNTLNPGANRKIETVDATSAAQAKAVKLYDGDTVDVMSVRAIIANKVTIEGAVDQPSDYPLRKGMRVDDLLEMARGPLPEAYLKKAELYRWNDNNSTTLIPVDLEKALNGDKAANIPLTRWDRLRVYTRQEVAWLGEHKVEVKGAVQRPGTYFLADNTRLSDLLMEVGGPTNNANLERAVLLHCRGDGSYEYEYPRLVGIHPGSANDPLIQDNDKLLVYAVDQAHFEPGHFVTVLGDVTAEGIYPRGDGMTVSDLLKDAGGFRPGANTSVVVAHARSVLGGPSSTIKTAEIQFDSQYRCAPQDDIRLQDGDIVTVQGNGGFVDKPPVIYVNGAVNKPGPIILRSKTVRLSDAIRLAGGPRKEAFLEGAEFYRNPDEMVSPEQRGMARLIADLSNMENESAYKRELAKSDLERIRASATASQPAAAGGLGASPAAPVPVAASLADELSTHDLVSRPRQLTDNDLTPNGNIAVNLIDALRRPGSAADITLVDGDTITIPVTPTTVQVLGAVVHSRGVLYAPGKGVQYY